jgi:glycosyltransferase involved in cell wall biosynthesis
MFSIVIPLYNKSQYIGKCIKTVLDQSYSDFEVIVVNDGSTDDSLQIIQSFRVPKFQSSRVSEFQGSRVSGFQSEIRNAENPTPDAPAYRQAGSPKREGSLVSGFQSSRVSGFQSFRIINQKNAGVSVARNIGVKEARFDHIAFLDADDWWDEHFLEEMKNLVEKYPDAGIWGCNYFYRKNGIDRIEEKGLDAGFNEGYINYFKVYASSFCVPFNCSFVVVNKKAFNDTGGFDPQLKFGEDFDLWVRIALKYKVAYLNKPLAYSNQDIAKNQRSLGNEKSLHPQEHVIFNLDYLDIDEKNNPELRKLLNGLRVRSLVPFYLNGDSAEKVNSILSQIDLSLQPLLYRFIYSWPKPLVIIVLKGKTIGSKIKQIIRKKKLNLSKKH